MRYTHSGSGETISISWLGFTLAVIPAALIILIGVLQPSPKERIEQQTQIFLTRLSIGDTIHLKETFTQNLSERFTSQEILEFSERENITPLKTWAIHNSYHFKQKGLANVQTPQGIIRLDYVGKMAGWKLQNFCQVNRFTEETASSFVNHLRLGNLEAAQRMTVDAAFPRRQGRQFPSERLQKLHKRLKESSSEVLPGKLSLPGTHNYHQAVKVDDTNLVVRLHHWRYNRSGCQFFVFDIY
ncbi:MAG: hypothetical protein AAF703_00225 [Cyanobacteria bacterium P01_D01_bin.105]